MVRTQISLTARQKTRSQLIRQAVDSLIEQSGHARKQAAIDRVVGLWKDRKDLPDFKTLRKSWERS